MYKFMQILMSVKEREMEITVNMCVSTMLEDSVVVVILGLNSLALQFVKVMFNYNF